ALGGEDPSESRNARGRAYLEKIVQLQIPLPAILEIELEHLLFSELNALKDRLNISHDLFDGSRLEELKQILAGWVVRTPRDIKRLIETFQVYATMLKDEVDLVDVLAYCALIVKSPGTVDRI